MPKTEDTDDAMTQALARKLAPPLDYERPPSSPLPPRLSAARGPTVMPSPPVSALFSARNSVIDALTDLTDTVTALVGPVTFATPATTNTQAAGDDVLSALRFEADRLTDMGLRVRDVNTALRRMLGE